MKKTIFLSALIATALTFFSCSTDDNPGGGGGGGVPIPIHATLYAVNNSSNTLGITHFVPEGIQNQIRTLSSSNNAGIFYIKGSDELVVNAVDQKSASIYGPVKDAANGATLNLKMSTPNAIENPHDVAVFNEFVIISAGETGSGLGKLYVYQRDDSGLTLRNTLDLNEDIYGIVFIGNDLYATIANTNKVAVFKNFVAAYPNSGSVVPDKQIGIGGITNIRGIATDEGVVLLTDIGDENHSSDGSFHYINRFVLKFNETEPDAELKFNGNQVRVSGSLTGLGNPLGIAYDHTEKLIFVAENKKNGGAVLYFENVEAGGDIMPARKEPFSGATSVFFSRAN